MLHSSIIKAFIASAAAGVATFTFIPAAQADVGAETVSARVSYADLDLASDVGVNRLRQRVSSAARAICAADADQLLAQKMQSSRCADQAIANGFARIAELRANGGRPRVTVESSADR